MRTTIPAMSRMLPTRVLVSSPVASSVVMTEPGVIWVNSFDAAGIPASSAASLPCVMTVPSGMIMDVVTEDADVVAATATQTA